MVTLLICSHTSGAGRLAPAQGPSTSLPKVHPAPPHPFISLLWRGIPAFHILRLALAEGGRPQLKSGQNAVLAGRARRQNEAKQARENKRSESLAQRRRQGPPTVVALLPLSAEADCGRLWQLLLDAFASRPEEIAAKKTKGSSELMEEDAKPGAVLDMTLCSRMIKQGRWDMAQQLLLMWGQANSTRRRPLRWPCPGGPSCASCCCRRLATARTLWPLWILPRPQR